MKKSLLVLFVMFTTCFSLNAQLEQLKKKGGEKLKQTTEKEIDKQKSKSKNDKKEEEKKSDTPPANNSNNSNPQNGTNKSTSSMPPANNPQKTTPVVKTKLTYRTANAIFPNDEFYKSNVGKVLLTETSKRENEQRSIKDRVRTESPVNAAMSFYVALPTTPHDFPVYPKGDTLKDGFEISNSNIKLVFQVKNSPLTFTYYNDYPINLGEVQTEINMTDFYGSNIVGNQRDYADYQDLRDSIPHIISGNWQLFLESLPMGKNHIEVTAWITYRSSQDEAFYPVSVANGEFIFDKTLENANVDYYSRFKEAVLNRRYREALKHQVIDEGITSQIHKENLGKIVFSKSPILKGNEVSSSIISSFSGADPIYGRMYLEKTISNVISRDASDTLRYIVGDELIGKIYINGKEINTKGSDPDDSDDDVYGWICNFPDETSENKSFTTHEVVISPDRSSPLMQDYFPALPYFLNELAPGTYTIRIEAIGVITDSVYASGEFAYTKVSGTVMKYGFNLSQLECKKGLDSDALEAQIKKAFMTDEDYGYFRENFSVNSITVCDKEWTVNRNVYGTILNRAILADILLKDKFGNYRLIHNVTAIQEYNGSGYGLMYLGSRASDYYVVPGK